MWKPQEKNNSVVIELNLPFGLCCGVNEWLLLTPKHIHISKECCFSLTDTMEMCFSCDFLTQS